MNIEWDYNYYQSWSDNEWLVDEMLAMLDDVRATGVELQEIPQLNYNLWNMLQPTSRRFLRELDEAPGGIIYIIYVTVSLHPCIW